ncbi:MAG: DUF1576 domain-containing protein [Clostridiales bacterium]|nr:DUF1576 domain-containing protein [Clostridiales bacterium]
MSTNEDKNGACSEQAQIIEYSNVTRCGVFLGFGGLLVLLGILLTPSWTRILEGFQIFLTSNIHLDTASFYVLGSEHIGIPFICSGILGIVVMLSYLITKTEIKGGTIAAAFMVMGFAFCGKSFLNVWPTFLGVLLYAGIKKKPVNSVMGLAWFSSALSPLVNTIAMYTVFDGSNTMSADPILSLRRVLCAAIIGVMAGFLVGTFAELLPAKHSGSTLYNAGFAAGLTGFLIFSLMKVIGIGHSGPSHVYTEDKDLLLGSCLAIMLLYLLVLGLIFVKKSGNGCRALVTGRYKGCFVDQFGFGASLINMSLCGLLCLLYPFFTTTGHVNAPLFACLLTVVGFASNGITLKTMVPIMSGVFATSVITGGIKGSLVGASFLQSGLTYAGSKNMVIAACFGCGLSPVVTEYGALVGFLAAMIHSILVPNTGVLHGWLNLYNNGFCIGLVATFFVPMLVNILKSKKKLGGHP